MEQVIKSQIKSCSNPYSIKIGEGGGEENLKGSYMWTWYELGAIKKLKNIKLLLYIFSVWMGYILEDDV